MRPFYAWPEQSLSMRPVRPCTHAHRHSRTLCSPPPLLGAAKTAARNLTTLSTIVQTPLFCRPLLNGLQGVVNASKEAKAGRAAVACKLP